MLRTATFRSLLSPSRQSVLRLLHYRPFSSSFYKMGVERIRVGSTQDFDGKEYGMKECAFKDDLKVLLVKVDGGFTALASKCSHYGGPLAGGVITSTGRIVCPWHGACFNGKTGDIEDAPAPQNLQKYKLDVEGTDIYVTADPEQIKENGRKTKAPKEAVQGDKNGVVIVGGGSGALFAVEGLRESGYAGPVKIISKEKYIPIDRTKLSKALIDDAAKLAVRDESWYKENKIDLQLDSAVKSVDIEEQSVTTEGGQSVSYDHLILATGSYATRLPLDGKDLGNIFVLRTIEDTAAINKALAERSSQQPEALQKAEEKVGLDKAFKPNLVVIGSSWIGTEVAQAAMKKANVTVVGMDEVPFQAILGKEIGAALKRNHEKSGIKFYLPTELSHFEPSDKDKKMVGSVVLKSGEKLPADVVILGTGVKPVTDYAQDIPGIQLNDKDKSIIVDEELRVKGIGKKNVYAIGDIAYFPDVKTGESLRIEHWNVAGNHGRSVASSIAGKSEPYNKTAIFWSAQGAQLRYVGSSRSSQYETVHIDGNPDEKKFVAYYGKGDEIVAVASMGRDPIVTHCSELFTFKKMPSFSEVKGGKNPLDIPLQA